MTVVGVATTQKGGLHTEIADWIEENLLCTYRTKRRPSHPIQKEIELVHWCNYHTKGGLHTTKDNFWNEMEGVATTQKGGLHSKEQVKAAINFGVATTQKGGLHTREIKISNRNYGVATTQKGGPHTFQN